MATKTSLFKSPYDPLGLEQMVEYVDNQVIIKFRENATESQISSLLDSKGLEKVRDVGFDFGLYSTSVDPIALVDQLKDDPIVEVIDLNLIRGLQTSSIPRENFRGAEAKAKDAGILAVALFLGLILFTGK